MRLPKMVRSTSSSPICWGPTKRHRGMGFCEARRKSSFGMKPFNLGALLPMRE